MELHLLCVGDVVGNPGRRAVREGLPVIADQYGVDCCIVNAENAAGGSGLTPAIYEKLLRYGVDLITMGDHVYRRAEIIPVLETSDRMVRPANFPIQAPGKLWVARETASGHRVAVISLMGRMYMNQVANCPFAAVDAVLGSIPKDIRIIAVDMHAEVTSEKVAMGWHLDGRVSVLFGTHTHVPTADARVLPGGTAYITDLGMTGPYDSVLGRLKQRVVRTMITSVPSRFDVADHDVRLCGVLVKVDTSTGKALGIERIEYIAASEA